MNYESRIKNKRPNTLLSFCHPDENRDPESSSVIPAKAGIQKAKINRNSFCFLSGSPIKSGMTVAIASFFLTLPLITSSAGLSVTPSRLEASLTVNEPHSFTLTVENPTSEVALIETYPDDFQPLIIIEPKSFTLESGARKKVLITVTPEDAGTFSTLLSIVSRPLGDRSFKTGTGIKIPLQFEAVENQQGWPKWMIGIAAADALLLLLLIRLIAARRMRQ